MSRGIHELKTCPGGNIRKLHSQKMSYDVHSYNNRNGNRTGFQAQSSRQQVNYII
jgi:hypothetical protein